ncbi:MAG: hypothetical protein ABSC48_06690 [Terracidiphilus sp.]|jgi:uncharacterized membrane protein YdfJ with MMPL/SSD domain
MKHLRSCLRWSLALVAVWLILCAAIGILAMEMALHPGRRLLEPKSVAEAQAVADRNHADLAEVSIVASDGATLLG